jgi:hypothetical protein
MRTGGDQQIQHVTRPAQQRNLWYAYGTQDEGINATYKHKPSSNMFDPNCAQRLEGASRKDE